MWYRGNSVTNLYTRMVHCFQLSCASGPYHPGSLRDPANPLKVEAIYGDSLNLPKAKDET